MMMIFIPQKNLKKPEKKKFPPVFSHGLKIFAYYLTLAQLRIINIFIVSKHETGFI